MKAVKIIAALLIVSVLTAGAYFIVQVLSEEPKVLIHTEPIPTDVVTPEMVDTFVN